MAKRKSDDVSDALADETQIEETETEGKETEEVAAPKPAKISKEEWHRRTKLDVSDHDYINPSLDHHK